jgi:hypothetical protein
MAALLEHHGCERVWKSDRQKVAAFYSYGSLQERMMFELHHNYSIGAWSKPDVVSCGAEQSISTRSRQWSLRAPIHACCNDCS